MIVLLFPVVVFGGIVCIVLFLTQLRAERQRGTYGTSYLFILLWLGGALALLLVTYNAYIGLLTYTRGDISITDSNPVAIFNNYLWALIPMTITAMILVFAFIAEKVVYDTNDSIPSSNW